MAFELDSLIDIAIKWMSTQMPNRPKCATSFKLRAKCPFWTKCLKLLKHEDKMIFKIRMLTVRIFENTRTKSIIYPNCFQPLYEM